MLCYDKYQRHFCVFLFVCVHHLCMCVCVCAYLVCVYLFIYLAQSKH